MGWKNDLKRNVIKIRSMFTKGVKVSDIARELNCDR
jgi:uncharacterized protein YjcR